MTNRLTSALDFQAQALRLRAERQRVLAGNIANADTPGYQARDLDFARALREATGALSSGTVPTAGLAATHGTHLSAGAGASMTPMSLVGGGSLVYARPSQTSLDGNTVDMDRERASFADNAVKYEATLRFVNSGVRTMLDAIKGQ